MIILVVLFFFILIVIFNYKDNFKCFVGFVSTSFAFSFITMLIFMGYVVDGRTIPSKIEMYETENEKIESDIDILVKEYMAYESDIYKNLKAESSITLVALYPDLKADILVQNQIDLYRRNNNEIRELKKNLIDLSTYKWCLYFGK